jgi:hypothetical protein
VLAYGYSGTAGPESLSYEQKIGLMHIRRIPDTALLAVIRERVT